MKQAHDESKTIKKARIQLGKMIQKLRDKRGFSLRELARQVDIPPSNLKYIEDGVNAPTSDKYLSIVNALSPEHNERQKLDSTYSLIRGTPPPDVCRILCSNKDLNDVIRLIDGVELNPNQIIQIKQLFSSFIHTPSEGETENGKDL